jgi:hypothetical protein
MNAKLSIYSLVVAIVSMTTSWTNAQMVGVEPIVVTLHSQPPGNVFEQYYPNTFDPNHPKNLFFTGVFTNADLQQPAFVDFWFDWIDLTGQTQQSGVFPIDLAPGQAKAYGVPGAVLPPIRFQIPFCPERVSVHIQNNGPGQPVVVDGLFTHICIPEPSSMLLAGLGLAGVGVVALRRRRS